MPACSPRRRVNWGTHLTYRPRRSHECSDHDATRPRCTQSLRFSRSYAAVLDLEPTPESTVRVRSAANRWPYHHGVAAGQCGWRYQSAARAHDRALTQDVVHAVFRAVFRSCIGSGPHEHRGEPGDAEPATPRYPAGRRRPPGTGCARPSAMDTPGSCPVVVRAGGDHADSSDQGRDRDTNH